MSKKLFYPATQIITGLYTAGKEFQLKDTGKEYIGSYHRYIDGNIMTGTTKTLSSKDLIPYKSTSGDGPSIYQSLTKIDVRLYTPPKPTRPVPTENDYKKGYFDRYIIFQRNHTTNLFEIDINQYKEWNKAKKGIDEKLYGVITLRWKLTGPETDNTDPGGILISGVVNTNMRTLKVKEAELPGIAKYLSDLREFSIWSPLTSSEIKSKYS